MGSTDLLEQEEHSMDYGIIDCDQHVIEPPNLWEKYLPSKYQDRAPKIVKNEESGIVQEHLVPHGKHLKVQSGDRVAAGPLSADARGALENPGKSTARTDARERARGRRLRGALVEPRAPGSAGRPETGSALLPPLSRR